MTLPLFISILSSSAVITALLTEAIKKFYYNMNKNASPNIIAIINALVVGAGETAVVYMLMDIPWTVNNVICLLCMIFAVWLTSMLGYDKVKQAIEQIAVIAPVTKTEDKKDDNAEGSVK